MKIYLLMILITTLSWLILIPIQSTGRHYIHDIKLTEIGSFGMLRKERPGVPAHYHTGTDIKRPTANCQNEPIFPIAEGRVISKRTDGPYAQLIVEHHLGSQSIWSLYEHVAGIRVGLNDWVSPHEPMARFMSQQELSRYGWQFDHLNLEVLKVRPIALKSDPKHPKRRFGSYSLVCYTQTDLNRYFLNPLDFFESHLKH